VGDLIVSNKQIKQTKQTKQNSLSLWMHPSNLPAAWLRSCFQEQNFYHFQEIMNIKEHKKGDFSSATWQAPKAVSYQVAYFPWGGSVCRERHYIKDSIPLKILFVVALSHSASRFQSATPRYSNPNIWGTPGYGYAFLV